MEANNDFIRLASAHANSMLDQMDMAVGLPGMSRHMKTQIPAKTAQQYNTVHNVSVQGGVVGAINTGEVRKIAVAIGNAEKQGNADLAKALKDFTDALVADKDLDDLQKKNMIDQLGLISAEINAPAEGRRPAVLGAVLDGLNKAVTASTGLLTFWERLHPLLLQAHHIK